MRGSEASEVGVARRTSGAVGERSNGGVKGVCGAERSKVEAET